MTSYAVLRRRLRARAAGVTAALAALVLALFVVTLSVGSYRVPLDDVVVSVLHLGENPAVDFVVNGLRMPTALAAVFAGLALGLAGTIFQQLLGNPLASPDFVGVSEGAGLAAVAGLTVFHVSGAPISLLAFGGAMTSAALIYLLAWKDGITGYRFILIGIGVSAFFVALTGWVVARSEDWEARSAMTWLTGSVGQAGHGEIRALVVTVLLAIPAAVVLRRQLGVLALGDDAARALGARLELARLVLLGLAILLVAVATAAVGPVMFVALVAGPIAARLLGPAPGLLAAGLAGAVVMLTADLIAQHLLPASLPTGVVTGAVGAPYLVWLLATSNRKS
ncbi:MAG: iron ABC transporter permease [Nocardioidaceae bacterium]|nr:iron ABC transporter permease [Nocardioidaceae bacterium]